MKARRAWGQFTNPRSGLVKKLSLATCTSAGGPCATLTAGTFTARHRWPSIFELSTNSFNRRYQIEQCPSIRTSSVQFIGQISLRMSGQRVDT